jgi:hypothetical protein
MPSRIAPRSRHTFVAQPFLAVRLGHSFFVRVQHRWAPVRTQSKNAVILSPRLLRAKHLKVRSLLNPLFFSSNALFH